MDSNLILYTNDNSALHPCMKRCFVEFRQQNKVDFRDTEDIIHSIITIRVITLLTYNLQY